MSDGNWHPRPRGYYGPRRCTFALREQGGKLWYGHKALGRVPRGAHDGFNSQHALTRAARDVIGGHLLFDHIYRCRRCNGWAVGSGWYWCSDACRRTERAEQARERRAAATVSRAPRTCVVCGNTFQAKRSTRRFCSDRCRLQAHHERRREA
jgi:predicted nucleic acid-binding Zn ribbon protein